MLDLPQNTGSLSSTARKRLLGVNANHQQPSKTTKSSNSNDCTMRLSLAMNLLVAQTVALATTTKRENRRLQHRQNRRLMALDSRTRKQQNHDSPSTLPEREPSRQRLFRGATRKNGAVLRNQKENLQGEIECNLPTLEAKPSNMVSADVGILDCGMNQYCAESAHSNLGGICRDFDEAGNSKDNRSQAKSGRRLQELFPITSCDPTSFDYSPDYCDCDGFDYVNQQGFFTCVVYEHYCFTDEICGSFTVERGFEREGERVEYCYNFVSPIEEQVCYVYDTSPDCTISVGGTECSSCQVVDSYVSPVDGFVSYGCYDFDCANTAAGVVGIDCAGTYVMNGIFAGFFPTVAPTTGPPTKATLSPTIAPSLEHTPWPTPRATASPTSLPTTRTTWAPTTRPTQRRTESPTATPTLRSTGRPTTQPTASPSKAPTDSPTSQPSTTRPTIRPSASPTEETSEAPTTAPTISPTSRRTAMPTDSPSTPVAGSIVTGTPTVRPTIAPTTRPTPTPSSLPTVEPTASPSSPPTVRPTAGPTVTHSRPPSEIPTSTPTVIHSTMPTAAPSNSPSAIPSKGPSTMPITSLPSATPTTLPTQSPTLTEDDRTGETSLPIGDSASPTPTNHVTEGSQLPTEKATLAPSQAPSPPNTGDTSTPTVEPTPSSAATLMGTTALPLFLCMALVSTLYLS